VVKLRLQRRGRKKLPVYKLVAADERYPRDGRFIEALGLYEPLQHPAGITLERERVMYWLGVGAQPTDTVRNLLSREGIILEFHLRRTGKTDEQVAQEMEKWSIMKQARVSGGASKKQLRAERKKKAAATPAEA
jgi:small subunit ribosomal protein S16